MSFSSSIFYMCRVQKLLLKKLVNSLFSFLYFKKMEIDRSLYGPYNEYNPKKKLESSRFVREQYEKRGSIDSAVIITVPQNVH